MGVPRRETPRISEIPACMGGTERKNPEEMRAKREARPQGFEGTDGREDPPPKDVREAQRGAVAEGGVLKKRPPKMGGTVRGESRGTGAPRKGGSEG